MVRGICRCSTDVNADADAGAQACYGAELGNYTAYYPALSEPRVKLYRFKLDPEEIVGELSFPRNLLFSVAVKNLASK
jgi:hypothetical protein